MRNIPRDLIRNQVYCVNYLVFLDDADHQRYCYVAVRQKDMPQFKKALRAGDFELDDFGVVLEEGEGDAPSHVQEKMHYLYNCNHTNALDVEDVDLTPTSEEEPELA